MIIIKRAWFTLILLSLLTACDGGAKREEQYLNRAQLFYEANNYEKAVLEARNVLQINPNSADARYLLGLIAEADNDLSTAFNFFSAAVQADSRHVKSLNKLASYYIRSRDFAKGQEQIDVVFSIDSNNIDALANTAVLHASKNENEKAILKAQQVLSLEPGNVVATTVLTNLYAQENPDLAMDVITKSIANQTENESLKLLKLRLLITQNKSEEVVQLYKELITEYPEKLFYSLQLSKYYLQLQTISVEERKKLAEKVLTDLIADNPEKDRPKLWLVEYVIRHVNKDQGIELLEDFISYQPEKALLRDGLVQLYIANGDLNKAKQLYLSVIEKDKKSAGAIEARNRLVGIAMAENDSDLASSLLEEVFSLDADNVQALIHRARLNISNNLLDDAIEDLNLSLKRNPESIAALQLLANVYEMKSLIDMALISYQQLLTYQPNNVPALINSAKILLAKNDLDESLRRLEYAAQIDDSNPEVARLLVDLYSREQRWKDAISISEKLLDSDQYRAEGYYLQGRIFLRQKSFAQALPVLEKAIELQPSSVETLSALIAAHLALEQTDQALNFVNRHVQLYPDHIHAKEVLASLYARLNEFDNGIEILEILLAQNPERLSAYTLLARLYLSSGQGDRVIPFYQQAIAKNPKAVALRLSLAETYVRQNDVDKAIESYEELLKIHPDSKVAKNNLASLLLDYADVTENASRITELTKELASSETPAFLDTAGWAQYKLGNYSQAIVLLDAAIENGGNEAVFHYHLGMAYFKNNLKVQAKEHLEQALSRQSSPVYWRQDAQEILKKL